MNDVGIQADIFIEAGLPQAPYYAVPVASEVYSTNVIASGLLTVVNRTALHFQLIASHNQTVIDELWLTKSL